MNPLKLRRFLISLHLWLAGLLAPAFLVVAISGGLYIAGIKGETTKTPIALPANASLDFDSPTIKDDVKALLEEQGVDINFEYIRGRGNQAMTRPTTRDFVSFQQRGNGELTAELNEPDLPYILMELHKGHGPRLYRAYQIVVAVVLFLVVIGGLFVGLLARNYRTSTLIAAGAGTVLTIALAML